MRPSHLTPSPYVCFSILAAIVAMWYARSKKYGEKNVMYDSYAWYNHMLSDTSQMKNMPEVSICMFVREGKGRGPVRWKQVSIERP